MPKTRNNFENLQPFRKASANVPQPFANRHENTPESRNTLENLQSFRKPPVHVQPPIGNQHESTAKTQPMTKANNAPASARSALPVGENVPSKNRIRGLPRRITCDHTNERLDAETPSSSEMDWINMLNRPKEAMTMKSIIPEPDLTPFAIPKGVLLVRILHVVNPNRIWVRCIAHQMPFEKLQNELNKYYKREYTQANARDYTWRMTEFQQGMYCAALWEGYWYRGIIVGPHMGGTVKVNLVDLGMAEFIDDRHIQYLQEDFSKPNVLAIRASLAFLKPRRPIWSRAESDHLERMLDKSEQFCANIVGYDEGHNAMDIVLQGAKMANVNKTFASEVDAQYVGKDQLTDEDVSCDMDGVSTTYLLQVETTSDFVYLFLVQIDAYRQRSRTINEKYPT
uniref:Tudor domain-containing protein n=1 Tax=Anopheles atroparvus TaxID=41427 RepID=A0AAG5DB10_ANOAO